MSKGKGKRSAEGAGGNGMDVDSGDERDESELRALRDETVDVEFEVNDPLESDFHALKTLLKQLFVQAPVDLSSGADTIIAMTDYVGCVIRVLNGDEGDGQPAACYGVISAFNLQQWQEKPFVRDVRALLLQKSAKHAGAKDAARFAALLAGAEGDVGYVVNERVANVPVELAPPMHANLLREIGWAVEDGEPYKFSHVVYLCKSYAVMEETSDDAPSLRGPHGKRSKRAGRGAAAAELHYCHFEDSLLEQVAVLKFSYPIELGGDGGLTERPTLETGEKLLPHRTCLVVPMDRVESAVALMQQTFGVAGDAIN